jgi:hypothetical protein
MLINQIFQDSIDYWFYWHLGSFLGVQFEFFDGEANIFQNDLYVDSELMVIKSH